MIKRILTIAGSDPSGGAGIQADLKTMAALGTYGMSVITALTAQNTIGVQGVLGIDSGFVSMQLESVFSDCPPHAVKIGMLFNPAVMEAVVLALERYKPPFVVLDPVMVSTSGDSLLAAEALAMLKDRMLPLATLVTPNLAETRILTGLAILSEAELAQAGEQIVATSGSAVLLKGGHQPAQSPAKEEDGPEAIDYLYQPARLAHRFALPRLPTRNTHGTGCTLSTAIAVFLALGLALPDAVQEAKGYVHQALAAGAHLEVGQGRGPLWHHLSLNK